MLPAHYRLRSTALFGQTIRQGRKKGSRTVVVYCYAQTPCPVSDSSVSETSFREIRKNNSGLPIEISDTGAAKRHVTASDAVSMQGGPRVGLIVSKAVGNAVARHHVSRLIRHAARDVLFDENFSGHVSVSSDMLIVIRALPQSSEASFEELRRDVSSCIRRATK